MMNRIELPIETLRRLLRYEPETGKLYWLPRIAGFYTKNDATCNAWNARFAGKEAGTPMPGGYIQVLIARRGFRSSRIAWALTHGVWPGECIDHINGIPSDNRLANLRNVSKVENGRNRARSKSNVSGVMGVDWREDFSAWRARIIVDGKQKHLGLFNNFEEAVSARKAAERAYGFHENHGRNAA